ncbi:MAG: hypothetical protein LBS89_02555 [Zoogloeaceae bacterium]|jgi:hypothetical protein|nr:hypothetical protein [Zoogloeaceae bacterium]
MNIAMLVLLALVTHECRADAPRIVPRMTGEKLVRYFSNPPSGQTLNLDQLLTIKLHGELALSYLDGVADAGQGTVWCDRSKVKTHEINSMILAELEALSPDRLRESAAILANAVLQKHFPCP